MQIAYDNNKLFLKGELNFTNAEEIYENSLPHFMDPATSQTIEIDFSQVTAINSVGLALIVEWLKWAKSHQMKISFSHLSTKIMEIAKVAGAESLFL